MSGPVKAPLTLRRLEHNVFTLTVRDPDTKEAIPLTGYTMKFRGFTDLEDPDGSKVAAFTKDVTESTDLATVGDITDAAGGVVKFTWTKTNMSVAIAVTGVSPAYHYCIKAVNASGQEQTVREGLLYIEREGVA